MPAIRDGRNKPPVPPRNHEEEVRRFREERAKEDAVPLTEAQRIYLEREKQAELEAMRMPLPPKVAAKPEPIPYEVDIRASEATPDITIRERLAQQRARVEAREQAIAVQEADEAKVKERRQAELEAERVELARVLNEERELLRAENRAALASKIKALKTQREQVQTIFDAFDPTLKRMAQSCASGPTSRERVPLQEIYNAASPLREEIYQAFKAITDAQTKIERALKFSDPLWAEQAHEAIATAMKFDAVEFAARAEALIVKSGIVGKPSGAPMDGGSWRRPPEPGSTVITNGGNWRA